MNDSASRADQYRMGLADTKVCECNQGVEDSHHFFFGCIYGTSRISGNSLSRLYRKYGERRNVKDHHVGVSYSYCHHHRQSLMKHQCQVTVKNATVHSAMRFHLTWVRPTISDRLVHARLYHTIRVDFTQMTKVNFVFWLLLWYWHLAHRGHSSPLTSSWPHLRCDVGLEEGEYK